MRDDATLAVGDAVEVHTKFNDTWVAGFDISAIVPNGYQVRRVSDGALLPGFTSREDVRAAP